VAAILALPIFSIIILAFLPGENIWPHLVATVLPHYFAQTIFLLAGVGLLTFIIGITLAWLITAYEFPGAKVFQWLALLPLAMPGYIVAYNYVELFTYAGPFQTSLRAIFGWTKPQDYYFPDIRSMAGAIFVLSFVLYPYVYIAARAAFIKQSMNQIDVARSLGKTPWIVFKDIVLPQARPAIVVGLMLVAMECLNDIAAVNFFGVQTLTLGIYSTWLGQGNLGGAAQLAFLLLIIIAVVLTIERHSRKVDQRLKIVARPTPIAKQSLRGIQRLLAIAIFVIPILIGFILPGWLLTKHALRRTENIFSSEFLSAMTHSLLLAGSASVLTIILGLVLAYANRTTGSRFIRTLTVLATLGYAVPGTVLAIGLLVPFGWFDNWLDAHMRHWFGFSTGLVLSGSMVAVLLAYVIRFQVIAFGNLESGLEKITPNLDSVARTLGRKPVTVMKDIHLPILRPALKAAALLVFVDAMKELPATLILRPFDFDTLATHVFNLASLDKLEDSAMPALAIVLAGLIPVVFLSRNLTDPVHATRPESAADRL
jgi:iron(III) transport system permease protein